VFSLSKSLRQVGLSNKYWKSLESEQKLVREGEDLLIVSVED